MLIEQEVSTGGSGRSAPATQPTYFENEHELITLVVQQAETHPEVLEADTFEQAVEMTIAIHNEVLKEAQSLTQMSSKEKKAYYKQFSLRELAYITNSKEITHSYAHSIIQSATKNPLDYAGRLWKYEDYQRRATAFTSQEILDINIDYAGYSIDDFFELWSSGQWCNDKCRYVMSRLGIYNYEKWHDLTGFVPKGHLFLSEVGKNIGKVLGFGTEVVSEIGKGVFSGLFEGLGFTPEKIQSLKKKLIIAIIIIVIVLILIGLFIFWIKSRMLKSSLGIAKEVIS